MTSRERVLAALRRQDVDYVPFSQLFYFSVINEGPRRDVARDRRYNWPWPPSKREEIDYCVHELGLDNVVPLAFGSYRPGPGVSSRVWMEDGIIYKVWTTPAGELCASVRYDDRWPWDLEIPFFADQNPGYFRQPWLETEQDLECLRHVLRVADDQATLDSLRFQHEKAKKVADMWGLATFTEVGMGLTGAMQVCGAEGVCLMAIDNPDLLDAYLELEHQLNLRKLEIALDFGVDIVKRNGFYESADFYSPETLDRFLRERLNREADTVRQAGAVSCYTIHTGLGPILGHLKKLHFDCLMQVDPVFNDLDLAAVRDSQEGSKSFWLGPSNTYHIGNGPEVVKAALRDIFEVLAARGLIVGVSPGWYSVDPWEELLAMVEEWKQLRAG